MSKLSDKKALAEIKRNVKAMLRDALKHVDEGVDHCVPAGIVQDHGNASGPFIVPREFLMAFCDDIKMRYGPPKGNARRIRNYGRFI